MAVYIQRCLEGLFQVDMATNGNDGIDQAVQTLPDILISDVMMPEKDGFEVCQAIKNDERTSHIPVILLTAKADIDSRLAGLSAGADAYLSKPFVKEELLIRLQKLIELRQILQQRYSTMQHSDSLVPDPGIEETLDGQFLLKVRQLIQENLADESFGNVQLASRIHLSESQLFRKLKALTGISTALYIRQIRLHQARQLLLNSDKTVAEIAYAVGFPIRPTFLAPFLRNSGFLLMQCASNTQSIVYVKSIRDHAIMVQ
ncbi:MAG: response regulator [Saprospiraceae bacterium]|nr:response regulator [Saprospiraceae bacterium]